MKQPWAGSAYTAHQKGGIQPLCPMLLHWHADVQKRGDAWAGLNASKNTSILSFFNFPLDGEDFEDLEGRQAIGWRGPGSLNDCMEQCSLSSTDLLWPYGLSNKPTLLELKA